MRLKAMMLAALACAAPALAQEPEAGASTVELRASSPWQVSFENGVCRAGRLFEAGGKSHVLTFEQIAPTGSVDVMIVGSAIESIELGQPIQIRIADTLLVESPNFTKGQIEDFGASITIMQLGLKPSPTIDETATPMPFGRGIDLEALADADRISITQNGERVEVITGPLRDVFQVLNDCTAHILKTWGFDAAKLQTAEVGPQILNPLSHARKVQEAYPVRALRNREQGTVGVLVKIDEEGRVYECEIISDSGSKDLNNAACTGMMIAKFEPAKDKAGEPLKSYFSTRISYRLN